MRITRQKLRDWGACYSDEEIAALVPEAGVTLLEVCDAAQISAEDRFWVLLRKEIIPPRELRLLACRWAASALIAAEVTDLLSWRAVWTAAQYAYGLATEDQRDAAHDDAYYAARTTARAAAYDAARATACATARAAAYDAAYDAARATACATARAAARAAARIAACEAQLDDVRRVLCTLR